MRSKAVRCKSGLMGIQYKLQDSYANFEEFESYCEIYGNHTRLGFKDVQKAWDCNPTIQSSTNPSDLCIVYFHVIPKKDGEARIKESTESNHGKVKNSQIAFSSKQNAKNYIAMRSIIRKHKS